MKRLITLLLFCISVHAQNVPSTGNRETINFDRDWKFMKANDTLARTPAYNDATWMDIGLPHTYNETDIFDEFNLNGDSGWGGVVWYRKHFAADSSKMDRMCYLEIGAARTVAEVWINGQKVGGPYYSGFSTFAVDLTPYLVYGSAASNVVAIRIDDTEGGGYGAETIAPGNSSRWHPVYGGLYTHVRLHYADKVHITLPFYSYLATEGVYIGTPSVTAGSAQYRITTEVKNNTAVSVAGQLTTEIVDSSGTVVSTQTAGQTVGAGALFKFDQTGTIVNPVLWSPRRPYLYSAYSTLRVGGRVVDGVATTFGVRTIGWDRTTLRFTINGTSLIIKGWGQKPTNEYASLGPAVPDWLHASDVALMKNGGGNIVRWGHCAGLPAALDAGDRTGLMQWQPNISGEMNYTGEMLGRKNIVMRDIIIRDRNHPSIVLWEGNNYGGSLANSTVWKGLVTQWDWITPRPYGERRPANCALMDVVLETNNENTYCMTLPKVESEFYRPEPPRRYWDEESVPGVHPSPAYGRTQRQAMREILADWISISSRGGGTKWHFSDAATFGRVETEVCRSTGSVDGMHLPKDIYYGLQAIWRDDPQVHIMGHWNYTGPHTVDVFTNCAQVELYVNGVSKSVQTPVNGRCSWASLPFVSGTLKAVGRIGGVERCSDERKTAGVAHHINLTFTTNPEGMKADRSDVALVDAVVVDANNIVCPVAADPVTFAVTGAAGSYRGGYNSYIAGTPGKATLNAEAGRIRVGVRSTATPGTFTVTATAAGLVSGSVSVSTIPYPVAVRPVHTAVHPFPMIGIIEIARNKNRDQLRISYILPRMSFVRITLLQLDGRVLHSVQQARVQTGLNAGTVSCRGIGKGVFLVMVSAGNDRWVKPVALQ